MSIELWRRFCRHYMWDDGLGIGLDVSRVRFPDDYLDAMAPRIAAALDAMAELEAGAIANPDEGRMVGHYWLRAPEMAPTPELSNAIRDALARVKAIVAAVHGGKTAGARGAFREFLVIGIGGSCLGPQFVAHALGTAHDRMRPHFLDNTDPEGIERKLRELQADLGRTLVIVISKSGGTPETRNGMLLTEQAYSESGLDFARHAIAVTQEGSQLDQRAEKAGWLARLPMWDWVGGRTSELSAVGLLPAALQGVDVDAMLSGAAAMDRMTRGREVRSNPAALLALMWYHVGGGRGLKDMVILPYKDRLEWFSRYLQQLVMESLGKEFDRKGNKVQQGIAVYGNKGSTDQHAYVQQLRDGIPNFFATFIEVLTDGGSAFEIEPDVTAGDYLNGFLQGTRQALYEGHRDSLTITVREVNAATVGALIALFERAVGLYAELIDVNAYHQPGVEAGKKAAAAVLDLQQRTITFLRSRRESASATEIAEAIGSAESSETVFRILRHLAANPDRGVACSGGQTAESMRFEWVRE